MRPPWLITLVCGASGVGKSSVAVPLAARYGVRLGEEDDIVTALKVMTTPQQQPVLHYWDTHPEAWAWPAEKIADLHMSVSDALRSAMRAVIADHIEFRAPMVLEGDYLVPELADEFGAAVRAVVLHEPDVAQIAANYDEREPGADHLRRASVSVEIGRRLAERAARVGVPVIAPRPWSDVLDRTDAALSEATRELRLANHP